MMEEKDWYLNFICLDENIATEIQDSVLCYLGEGYLWRGYHLTFSGFKHERDKC